MRKKLFIICSSCGLIKKTKGEIYPMIPLQSTKKLLRDKGLNDDTDVYALLCYDCAEQLRKK